MRRIVVFIAVAVFSWAQSTTGAKIEIEPKRYDFGTVKQGTVVKYTFQIHNKGTAPLIITDVKTSCGCTASNWPKEAIQPGKSAPMEITFNTTGKSGKQTKSITVYSNGSPPMVIVYLTGEVVE